MEKWIKLLLLLFPLCSLGNNNLIVSPPTETYFGDNDVSPAITDVYAKEINELEHYLNSFDTFIAQFKQSNKEGAIRYGKFFISKPGKIRCEYFKPSPVLLIINQNKVTFYDQDLDEVSHASSDINSLKLLTIKDLRFSSVNLVEIDKDDQFITLSIKERVKKFDSPLFLTLKFSYPKIDLKQITITTHENEIDMVFDKVIYNQPIGKQLFYFHRDLFKTRR